jgi:polysaccharide pyruvyl transferase WcaK-like protein
MEDPGKYGASGSTEAAFQEYLDTLVESSKSLLDRGYDIRLLSGDLADSPARRAFRCALEERLSGCHLNRIIDEPVASVADVLSQIASTDLVVATRFHNIVFGFLCGKPVISISFHHKCESLMAMMGMSDYCVEMSGLRTDRLIDAFRRLEANAPILRSSIRERTAAFRHALDQQYDLLFGTARQELGAAELIAN